MIDSSLKLPSGRAKLATVINAASDVITIDDVETALGLKRNDAAKLLSSWTKQGWLRRVGKGSYVAVQLDMLTMEQVVDDAWKLVPTLFGPAYIAGRSAAEYWDLTEQIFNDILVFSAKPVREKRVETGGVIFSLKHVAEEKIFGTKKVWRGKSRVLVSDPHRTIIDMMDEPAVGGGIQHVSECFHRYLKRPDADPGKLLGYADRLGNGAVFKRLGFLSEREPEAAKLIQPSRERLSRGHAKLDPALTCPRLVTRWQLRVPESWKKGLPP